MFKNNTCVHFSLILGQNTTIFKNKKKLRKELKNKSYKNFEKLCLLHKFWEKLLKRSKFRIFLCWDVTSLKNWCLRVINDKNNLMSIA